MGNPIRISRSSPTDNTGAVLKEHTKETIDGNITEGATIPNADWKFCGGGTFASTNCGHDAAGQCLHEERLRWHEALSARYRSRIRMSLARALRRSATSARSSAMPLRTISERQTRSPARSRKAVIRGVSQSGNFTRHYIHLGMNQDEAGRIVHEGAWPIIAGRRVANNSRWGQPDGVLELYQQGPEGPQWWSPLPGHGPQPADAAASWTAATRPVLPEGHRALRRLRSICPEDDHLVGGHLSGYRHPPARRMCDATTFPSTTHGGGGGGFKRRLLHAANCPGNNWNTGSPRSGQSRLRRPKSPTCCASQCGTGS